MKKSDIIKNIKAIIKHYGCPYIHVAECLTLEPAVHYSFGGQKHYITRFFPDNCEIEVVQGMITKGSYYVDYEVISLKNLNIIMNQVSKFVKIYSEGDQYELPI